MNISGHQNPNVDSHEFQQKIVRRLLMCAPTSYDLKYEINPWMKLENAPNLVLAAEQWKNLYQTLYNLPGIHIELIPQPENCPDMVFTANGGLVRGSVVLLSNFRHPERQLEESHFKRWFEQHGYSVSSPDAACKFEGEGDALIAGHVILAGYLKRSDICAHRWISDVLNVPVLSLELIDSRWYHLDTCLFVLNPNLIVYYPGAFDPYARVVLENNYETIQICEEEALLFSCNSIVIDKDVVMPAGCPQTQSQIEEKGFHVHPVEMSEFLKSGGAAKCLTLFLN